MIVATENKDLFLTARPRPPKFTGPKPSRLISVAKDDTIKNKLIFDFFCR
jgi:hypothetical protein